MVMEGAGEGGDGALRYACKGGDGGGEGREENTKGRKGSDSKKMKYVM